MCPNLAFASSAAFCASLGRTKQLGTKERNWLSQRRPKEGQLMHRDETTPFSSWENTENYSYLHQHLLRILWCMPTRGMEPRKDSCWCLPNRTHTTDSFHVQPSTHASSQTSPIICTILSLCTCTNAGHPFRDRAQRNYIPLTLWWDSRQTRKYVNRKTIPDSMAEIEKNLIWTIEFRTNNLHLWHLRVRCTPVIQNFQRMH